MSRVKKQLHEWDENLNDDLLPTNVVGELLPLRPSVLTSVHPSIPPFLPSVLRLLLPGGCLSAHR